MGRLSEMQMRRFIALLWGKPKSGKTVLASQFPQPFFIDLDEGISSVITLRKEWKLDFDFDVISITEDETTDPDFVELCGRVMGKQRAWMKVKKLISVLSRRLPLDATLVVDNLSRMNEYLVSYLEERTGHRPLQIQDWGEFLSEITDVMNAIAAARCNTILIAHEEVRDVPEDRKLRSDERRIERTIIMSSRARYRIPSIVDESWFLKTEARGGARNRRVVRLLQCIPDPMTATGSRSRIPDIEDPTYAKIKPYLEEALNRELPPPTWTPPAGGTNANQNKEGAYGSCNTGL